MRKPTKGVLIINSNYDESFLKTGYMKPHRPIDFAINLQDRDTGINFEDLSREEVRIISELLQELINHI